MSTTGLTQTMFYMAGQLAGDGPQKPGAIAQNQKRNNPCTLLNGNFTKEEGDMWTFQKFSYLFIGTVLTLTIGGCGANHYSVHEIDKLDPEKSVAISVDAKRRFLLSNVELKENNSKTENIWRFCAEPSPDVFSVLSQAASGGATFGQTSDPKILNIALEGAFSNAETASTIQRTQTINMLKEMMYRTCERFLNGQISELEYPIIAARDQRIMTSILAIEQLTGSRLTQPTVIAATGMASTGGAGGDAILTLDNAKKKVDEKAGNLQTAQNDFKEIDGLEGACETLMAKAPDSVKDAEKAKLTDCKEKKTKLDEADKEFEAAKTLYEAMVNLAGNPGASSVSTNAAYLSSLSVTDAERDIEKARLQAVQAVASTVEKIVDKSFSDTAETQFFCYSAIREEVGGVELRDACMKYLLARVNSDTAKFIKEYNKAKEKLEESDMEQFKKFWNKVSSESGKVVQEKLETLINAVLQKNPDSSYGDDLEEMKCIKEKEKILAKFRKLSDPARKALIDEQ